MHEKNRDSEQSKKWDKLRNTIVTNSRLFAHSIYFFPLFHPQRIVANKEMSVFATERIAKEDEEEVNIPRLEHFALNEKKKEKKLELRRENENNL